MDRQTQHGPRIDDAMKHDAESLTKGSGIESRADEGRIQEDAVDRPFEADDVKERSTIARFLDPSIFPANKEAILNSAKQNNAFDAVINKLASLAETEEFENVEAVWEALGGTPEERF